MQTAVDLKQPSRSKSPTLEERAIATAQSQNPFTHYKVRRVAWAAINFALVALMVLPVENGSTMTPPTSNPTCRGDRRILELETRAARRQTRSVPRRRFWT